MLRISKKLIDFYRRRTEGKRAWIRFVATVLVMGSIVAFFLYHTLTVKDTREAQTTVEKSFAFVKAQLVKYDNYASSDKAKSLVRLMDKADEAARVLRDEPGFGVDGLENYAREQRLDGILVLDSQLNTVMETEFGGDTRARWQSVIESENVASIVDYPVKSYMTRVQLEGETYDVAVVARRDAKGIVLAYTSKHDLVGLLGDVTLDNMFDGLQFNMDGVVVVAQNDKVVATNSSMLSGLSLEEALTLSDKEYARDRGGLYSVSYGGRTWLGDQQQMNKYTIYIFFPAKAVYATRTTVMGVAMGMFVLIWMSFVVLRFASEHASLEQQADGDHQRAEQGLYLHIRGEGALRQNGIHRQFGRRLRFELQKRFGKHTHFSGAILRSQRPRRDGSVPRHAHGGKAPQGRALHQPHISFAERTMVLHQSRCAEL